MTWGICTGLQWGHWNSSDLHIFFLCSESYFSVRLALIELSTAKIQMNSAELLITFTLPVHVIFLPNKLFKGVIPPSKEGDPL